MFYRYFRSINYICNIFGLSKPCLTSEGKSSTANILFKIWCLLIGGLCITSYSLTTSISHLKFNGNLELISDVNDLVACVIIILFNLINSGNACINIHKTFNIIFEEFNLDFNIIKLFAIKMYFWFSIPAIIFVILIIMEVMSKYLPYDLLIRIPIFLSMMILSMHLYVILALLKVVNKKLLKNLTRDNDKLPEDEESSRRSNLKYIISPSIEFIRIDESMHFDVKLLCKIYENLSTSVHLLEEIHGFEVLLFIWLMFTSGVVGMTLVVKDQATIKWLVIVKSILPIFWGFIECCINEQIRAEVDHTITLIIKCLIDYKCVPSTKPALETFKQLASNDRLQFTACNLFHLTYAMLLGTILNVITYSIILIQMF